MYRLFNLKEKPSTHEFLEHYSVKLPSKHTAMSFPFKLDFKDYQKYTTEKDPKH